MIQGKEPTKVQDITSYLEGLAPLSYQAGYDNCGLQVGNLDAEVHGVLACLDVTQEVLVEAVKRKCNLVVAHHPLLFHPIKKITSQDRVGRCVTYALREGLHIYALHTNLDHVASGMNKVLGGQLGLEDLKVLEPMQGTHQLLTVFVPVDSVEVVKEALYSAGAGTLGNYNGCSFAMEGTGSFTPARGARPHVGEQGEASQVKEVALQLLVPTECQRAVVTVLKAVHPYETPMFYLQEVDDPTACVGAGMVGLLAEECTTQTFLALVKEQCSCSCLRYTANPPARIKRVALCGGAGASLIASARRAKADVYLTADLKYHEFFEADEEMMLLDIGHYESEISFQKLVCEWLSSQFTTLTILVCTTSTNPVCYE